MSAFLWWMATPPPEIVIQDSVMDKVGPRGHAFATVQMLVLDLLSYVEEKEWKSDAEGVYAIGGDMEALRKATQEALTRIARWV